MFHHFFNRCIGHESGNGQRKQFRRIACRTDGHASTCLLHSIDHMCDICVVGSHYNEIMRIVSHSGSHGSFSKSNSLNEPDGRWSTRTVAVEDHQFQDITVQVCNGLSIFDFGGKENFSSEECSFLNTDHAEEAGFGWNAQGIEGWSGKIHGAGRRRGGGKCLRRNEKFSLPGNFPAFLENALRNPWIESGTQAEIRQISRSDGSPAGEAEVPGGRPRGQSQSADGFQAEGHGPVYDEIHVSFPKEIVGMAIIAHQQTPGPGVIIDGGKKICQVLGLTSFPKHEGHSLGKLLTGFFKGGAFVVGSDSRSDVGVQIHAAQLRSVAIHASLLKEQKLVQHVWKSLQDAGEVHHFRKTEDP
jgi:hypothetical protein